MLSILFNWLWITISTYLTGNACIRGMKKCFHSDFESSLFHSLFAGIMVTTLYAQVFSLFSGVGMAANVILMLFCVIYGAADRKAIGQALKWRSIKNSWCKRKQNIFGLMLLTVAVIFALASAGPAKLIDTDWYHAQTIRWIEEYGCVRGVANLFYSLGFNSAQHYFDALYSMKFLLGQSMKGAGGYFALLLFYHAVWRLAGSKERKSHIADSLAMVEIIYVIIITAFFTDPYTDTLPNCLTFFIMTEWIGMIEARVGKGKEKGDIFPYGFLCLLAVYATVVKTSAVMVVLLVIYPAFLLIQRKQWKQIAGYIAAGAGVAVPFLITNVRTTGYLVYLASGLDFFKVPWKIDKEVLKYSVASMIHNARAVNAPMNEVLNVGLSWIPRWFLNDSISHQILYIAVAGLILLDLLLIIRDWIKGSKQELLLVFPRLIIYGGIVYWLMTIPQVKYCWAYLLFPLVVVPVVYLSREKGGTKYLVRLAALGAGVVLLLYTGFYSIRTIGYVKTAFPHYLIRQADYQKHEMKAVKKDGQTFYIREENGAIVCGYYVFPYLNDAEMLEQLVVGKTPWDGYYLNPNQAAE